MKKLTCVFSSTHDHSEKTLKAFQEFIFSNLNCAMMQCIHVSLEAAIEQWKIMKATPENPSPKPNLEQFDNLCKHTKACDKVSKFLAIYSSRRLYTDWCMAYTDWCMAAPEKKTRKMHSGKIL